ncbi:hypothetical protein PZ78_15990 [Vreelandella venusta]|nr:hypothetical protein PZ78_15990 [Halomonas hydrothermalis]
MKNKPAKGNWVNYIFLLVAVSLLLCTLLVYGFLVIGELAFRVVESRAVIYVLIWLGCALYSLAITRVVYMRDSLIGYLPACVFGVFILGFFFSNMSNNIIASLKIGHFEDTLHVSRDVVQHVGEKHGFNLVDMPSEDFLVIENAWVIANLPGQIIISAGYDSKEKLSIPRQKLQSRTYWFE